MLIKILPENKIEISINTNHIVKIEPVTSGGSKITLINADTIITEEEFDKLHTRVRTVYARFYKA